MALARYKGRVGEDIVEEGHIGLDAADADLAHTTLGLAHRSLKGAVKSGDPVSYTHLDVYKRQGICRLVRRRMGR